MAPSKTISGNWLCGQHTLGNACSASPPAPSLRCFGASLQCFGDVTLVFWSITAAFQSGHTSVLEQSQYVQHPREQFVLQTLYQAKACRLGTCFPLLLGLVLIC